MRAIVLFALATLVTGSWTDAYASDWSITGLSVRPRLDMRYMGGSVTPDKFGVDQAEVDLRFSVNRDDEELLAVALGPSLLTQMQGRGRQMHFSNYYATLNFGVDRPKITIGQFVVPFGTLSEYDTHPLVLQTPYARTIGIRLDQGLQIEHNFGDTNTRFALTSGDGRGRNDGSWTATLRLARNYNPGEDALRAGVSLLVGKNMPVFHPMPDPVPMNISDEIMRADKWRLAVDLDWLHGIDEFRSELVVGTDNGKFVNGLWVQYNHPFNYKLDLTLQGDHWKQTDGSIFGLGAALHYKLDDLSGMRLAYEPRWARSDDTDNMFMGMVTMQYYRDFNLGF